MRTKRSSAEPELSHAGFHLFIHFAVRILHRLVIGSDSTAARKHHDGTYD